MLANRLRLLRYAIGTNNHSLSLLKTVAEKEKYLQMIEKNAIMDYRLYPLLPHQDPTSPQYIASELDEEEEIDSTKAYNNILNQFKFDLKIQREVWSAISKLDRPYKKGIRGVDTDLLATGPVKHKLADLGFPRFDPYERSDTFANQDRFIANTNWNFDVKFSNGIEWDKETLNRPVTKNFNVAKGYKYDVPVKPEEKYEYLADRLGHPEFLGTPMDRLLRLERDIHHPTYVNQPFIKQPRYDAHPSLNFEQGEVIYENTGVLEWCRVAQMIPLGIVAIFGLYIPLNLCLKTNLVLPVATQWTGGSLHWASAGGLDCLKLFGPVSGGVVMYTMRALLHFITETGSQYVVKASYSKDRELLFVKRINAHFQLEEDVYETAHLEILPPYQRSGVAHLSSQDEDGIWRMTCMNNKQQLLFYNQDKYWNTEIKQQFLSNHLTMWDKSYYGYNREELQEIGKKWEAEFRSSLHQQALPKK